MQGTISFPIFVWHGALGQLFYKKLVATKVWGGVMPQTFFPIYCAIVIAAAILTQKLFLVRGGLGFEVLGELGLRAWCLGGVRV
jgi:peptidoglycan/LPS O-acetylase OafA/YrhL